MNSAQITIRPGSFVNYWPEGRDIDHPRCKVLEVRDDGCIVEESGEPQFAPWAEIGLGEGDVKPANHPQRQAPVNNEGYRPSGKGFEPMSERDRRRYERLLLERGVERPTVTAHQYGLTVSEGFKPFIPIGARVAITDGTHAYWRGTFVGGGPYGAIVLTDHNGPQLANWEEITPESWLTDLEEPGPEPAFACQDRFRAAFDALVAVWFTPLGHADPKSNPLGNTEAVDAIMAAAVGEAEALWDTAPGLPSAE